MDSLMDLIPSKRISTATFSEIVVVLDGLDGSDGFHAGCQGVFKTPYIQDWEQNRMKEMLQLQDCDRMIGMGGHTKGGADVLMIVSIVQIYIVLLLQYQL